MGCGGSKPKLNLPDLSLQRNPDWKYNSSIKVEGNVIQQFKDHGCTSCCIGKVPITQIKVKILPSQEYCFVGLMEKTAADQASATSNGIVNLKGVYGCGMSENDVVMNGQVTHYKRPALQSGDFVEFKYTKDRIFFKIAKDWDLLYVVGEGKEFVFVCEICHLYSRVEIIESTKLELPQSDPPNNQQ
ncbi:hypothetical protein EHI8A_188970 [Entamoeba histolytica HM-1:IMSS-B]|uniref:Uncharacterized protein n=6 Tax=Entamoeba histolytica TaxID=5759 RepID=B1N3N5_ENTH1|nr:hypothetical protein EHI_097920 [Entamoeba histolytica HM-1:IMSS]EMD48782.1 Hypothetical protein EHI5A_029080 [Entamoeba histolytica KU27]EMH76974.1 hypothetical protein EHI8A_188970 [Entamoeba histolytica HM-1:IMSS-B]EMS10993.1 hypothetical protein KM1_030640 [Entamoeba histolytica HM-3:IMSS]ENY62940.1 hypothetical protein EHI7A_013410 [Entamoeba histolytica HM-1:IMSS-A]GAT96174.1 hypothetical protein CL6EHI_097920 [Entamoeba histolytica]|eukprot:XP_001913801.1 hypothetical protein EHI_097920 [Entamoeba histolytica HM-1:IMSS]